jgi:ribonuclease D
MSAAPLPPLIDDPGALAALVARAAASPVLAFDVEFASSERFTPVLCLVQIGWPTDDGGVEAHLVDALAVDVGPLVALLAAPRVVIAHGARQDVALLATRHGHAVSGLFDTQVAAAFLGLGDQVGYGRLVEAELGHGVDKEQQWTAWEKRPLSPAQLRYALADVTHLPPLYARLGAALDRRGRRAWAEAESASMVAEALAAAGAGPDDAWRALGGARGLDRASLCALRELAAWRLTEATRRDVPIGRIADERALLDLARKRPRGAAGLRGVRSLVPDDDLAAAVAAALARAQARLGAGDVPEAPALEPNPPRVGVWAEIILALVAEASAREQVAARLLATRADVERLARAVDRGGLDAAAGHPLLEGWRGELVGRTVLAWLGGKVGLFASVGAPLGLAAVDESR